MITQDRSRPLAAMLLATLLLVALMLPAAANAQGTPGGTPLVSVTASDRAFTFSRGTAAPSSLTVAYTVSGDAVPGEDYEQLPGTVRFDADAATAMVAVVAMPGATEGAAVTVTVTQGESYDVGNPPSATVVLGDPGDPSGPGPGPDPDPAEAEVTRLAGDSRYATAVAISQDLFPEDGTADAVILAAAGVPFDALAGTPLAPAENGPLLLTDQGDLNALTAAEIYRVLAEDGTVFILGGTSAISEAAEAELAEGTTVVRLAGETRVETALAVAEQIGDPAAILIASGDNFPDALSAGAAAAEADGLVLLTREGEPHPAVQAYLDARPDTPSFAIGGPAAAVFPGSTALVGSGREATSVAVAEEFFDAPAMIGLARGDEFADALTGGAHAAISGGPVLLTPNDSLNPDVQAYSCNRGIPGAVYGGTAAISEVVAQAFENALNAERCEPVSGQ